VTDFMLESTINSTWLTSMSVSVESGICEATKWLGYNQLKPQREEIIS